MNNYELVCILDPQVGEGRFDEAIGAYEKYLEGQGAEIVHIDRWGMRKLAYTSVALKRRQQGYYVLFQMRAQGEVLPELEQRLKLDEDVLRYLIVVVEGEFLRVPQLAPEGLLSPSPAPQRSRGPERSENQAERKEAPADSEAKKEAPADSEAKEEAAEEKPQAEAENSEEGAPAEAEAEAEAVEEEQPAS